MNRRACASAGVAARFVGGQRSCCSCPGGRVVSIDLNSRDPRDRSDGLNPARVQSRVDALDLVEGVVAVDLDPQMPGEGVEGHAEAVADAVGEDLAEVRGRLRRATRSAARQNGLSRGVEPSSFRRSTTPVRCASSGCGPAELVVVARRRGALGQVLQPAATALVADDDVQLAVGAEANDAAVVVAARILRRVALVRRLRRGVVLERAQRDQVAIEGERLAVPDESIDAIAEQRDLQDDIGVVAKKRTLVTRLRAGPEDGPRAVRPCGRSNRGKQRAAAESAGAGRCREVRVRMRSSPPDRAPWPSPCRRPRA